VAILRIQRPKDVTYEMYQGVQAKIDVNADPPPGLIVHTAGEVDGALQIVDVWESQDDAERFAEERLRPAIRELAGEDAAQPPPPGAVTIYELKNLVQP
jgi:hypothetical protein